MFRCVCVSVRVRAAVCPDIFLRLGPLREGNVADSPGVESVRVCMCACVSWEAVFIMCMVKSISVFLSVHVCV